MFIPIDLINRETGLSIFQLVQRVLNKTNTRIDVNATNGSGLTAMDIHYAVRAAHDRESDKRIEDFLHSNGARLLKELHSLRPGDEPSWKKHKHDTLMVVSSLIATMAFLVGLTPPGGVWVDTLAGDKAGKAIIAYRYPNAYPCLMYVNTVGFVVSLTTILLLIIALPAEKQVVRWIRSVVSWLTIMTTAFTYTFSVVVVTPRVEHERSASIAILVTVISWAVVTSLILQARFGRDCIRERWSPKEILGDRFRERWSPKEILGDCFRERRSAKESVKMSTASPVIQPRPLPDEELAEASPMSVEFHSAEELLQ